MLPGFVYFVSIHTVPPVPKGPVGKVYRDVPEAYQTLPPLRGGSRGKVCCILLIFAKRGAAHPVASGVWLTCLTHQVV